MSTAWQLFRYGCVGLFSSSLLYLFYLGMLHYGMPAKLAVAVLWCIGALQTFFLHRRVTFAHEAAVKQPLMRYLVTYLMGYAVNTVALDICISRFEWSPAVSQALLTLPMAFFLFSLQKYWVFSSRDQYIVDIG